MATSVELPSYRRLSLGARTFAVVAAAIPVVAEGGSGGFAVLLLAIAWMGLALQESLLPHPLASTVAESIGIAMLAGSSVDGKNTLLVALIVPGFTAALRLGFRGLALAVSLEVLAFLPVAVARSGTLTPDQATSILTWMLAAIGLGGIGAFVFANDRAKDPLAPYLDAQQLIRELIGLSGTLNGSLDALAPAHRIAEQTTQDLPVSHLQVAIARADELSAVVSIPEPLGLDLSWITRRAWTEESVVVDGDDFAFPLRTGSGQIGVVTGRIGAHEIPPASLLDRIEQLRHAVADYAVHLDTALLFATLRETASEEERRRLAREMHDGIAQDIASLGYLVDALARHATPHQTKAFEVLRSRISDVVGEVRQSVQALRSDVNASPSLGAAISSLARHLSETSSTPIRVSLDERTARLRPEVEAQLLRIAQEAMNNAVRHADASRIEVQVRVIPGSAQLVVKDNGVGLKPGRPDSHGLSIMRERAQLIDADLEFVPVSPHGTAVIVRTRTSSRRGPRPGAARMSG